MGNLSAWIQRAYLLLFALLPWSLECSFGAWSTNLPGEPLIALIGLALAMVAFREPGRFTGIVKNQVILQAGLARTGWLAVCAACSVMPLVSWKYWLVETGQFWVFAAGMAIFPGLFERAFRIFAISMCAMVAYTLAHHAFYHFRADQALLAPMPFFPENTLYAAVLAMTIFPFVLGWRPQWTRTIQFPLFLLMFAGLFFSFCQAAWASVLAGIFAGAALYFRKYWRRFLLVFCLGGMMLFAFRHSLGRWIAADVSLQERFNRYACAGRMAADRPWTGFGPGTFQFQYLHYQRPEEMTRISLTLPMVERSPDTYGRGGGAHSEFFQALSETGVPGLLIFCGLVLTIAAVRLRDYFNATSDPDRLGILILMLPVLVFLMHALVNNLLHDARIAGLLWGFAVAGQRRVAS